MFKPLLLSYHPLLSPLSPFPPPPSTLSPTPPLPLFFPLLLSFSYVPLFPFPSSSPLLLLSPPPSSLVTPNGLTSIPAGVETSEMIQLRTKVIEEEGERGRKKGRFVEERDGREII